MKIFRIVQRELALPLSLGFPCGDRADKEGPGWQYSSYLPDAPAKVISISDYASPRPELRRLAYSKFSARHVQF